ncbi:MAG: PKD domain-containing protein [Bacteroidota bacterium]
MPISVKNSDCGGPVVLEIPYSGAGILWDNPAASTADTAEYSADGAVNVSVDDNYGASISFGNATAVGDTSIEVGTPVGSDFTLPSDTVCADTNETYAVGPNVNPPGTAYDWDFDGAGNAQGNSVDFAFPDPGTYDVRLIATDPSGNCTDTTTLSIVVEDCAPVAIPSYDIGTVTADSDNDGLADSIGVKCELSGTVYGVDLQGGANNLQFTLIDATGGIAVVNFGNTFGYSVQEGDLVRVVGTIDEFNGLAQIEQLDTIELLGGNQPLGAPAIVTSLGEDTESEFIEIQNLTFVDTAEWDGSGSSFNIEATDGTNTYTIRIDNDVDLADLELGFDYPFNLVGIGGQFDNSAPFTEGYQILPRNSSDFTFDLPVSVKSEGCNSLVLQIPYDGPSISWSNGSTADTTLVTSTGAIDAEIPDFGANANFGDAAAVADTLVADLPAGITFDSFSGFPGDTICVDESYTLSFTGSTADTYSWDFGEGGGPVTNSDSSFSYTYFAEGTFSGEIVLSSGACTLTETFTITVAADNCTPSSRPSAFGDLNVYPNPANERVNIETTAQLEHIQLFDLQGRAVNNIRVERTPAGYSVQLPDVAQGLYLLQLRSADAQTSLKLQVR